jgi:predicted enzyme related to lactoylglutathione lyase
MDVMTQGRMAMIADPSGAIVGLWEPIEHQGAEVFNVPGSVTWNEIQTRDLDAAKAFYASVFGWRWEESPPGQGYWVCLLEAKPGEDKSNGGGMTMPPGVPDDMPNLWTAYFRVSDCEASLSRAQELGGAVAYGPMPMGPGRGAGIVDPTGAIFNVIEFQD